ncbi:MAG: hypothetical protein ABEJ23_08770 [Haloarculaceae archaeon]
MVDFDSPVDLAGYPDSSRLDLGWLDRRAVYAASIVGFLVDLNALLIPVLQVVGGGLVAGFVGGYAAGRPGRGAVQGALAAGLAGVGSSVVVVSLGWLVGLFVEPPALLLHVVGPISPAFTRAGGLGLLPLLLALTLAVALDGLLAGLVGGGLKALVERLSG